jgi:glucose/arabinose dehydrogenase
MRIASFVVLFLCTALPSLRAQAVSGLTVERVATGLSQPIYVTAPPNDTSRVFIVQQSGQILILNLAALTLNATPFLNIQARLVSGGERGLLGLAFDPDYATNGKFYVNYTAPGGAFGNGVTRVSQFTVSADPNLADSTSEKILLSFDQPQTNHNGGWIGFSPRAGDASNLYIASGDGGGGNDEGVGHIEPGGNAQNPTTLLGKMLRITVNAANGTYSIPPNNPFAGATDGSRGEVWTTGLRNPYRASFDRLSGTLFIGDVGQSAREEISVQKASNPGGGENYGWRLREGDIQTPGSVGGARPAGNVDPIFAYERSVGRTVIGGYVYRGRQIPALRGVYVFGDYLGPTGGPGRIFTFDYDGTVASNFQDITAQLFPSGGPFTVRNPSSFGEDANGELYMTDLGNSCVYRIVPVTPTVSIASVESDAGTFRLRAYGVPFKPHRVQAASTLVEQFQTVATVNAAGDGSVEFAEAMPSQPAQRFYRVSYP